MGKLKKALVVLSIVAFSANAFGQLEMRSAKTYETIYSYASGYGAIRDCYENGIYFMSRSDNQFEKTYHTIYLGKTQEEVLESLDDLERLKKECPKDGVMVVGLDCQTKIYRYMAGTVAIKSDGVAGYGYYYINFKKAKQKIEEYFQSKE